MREIIKSKFVVIGAASCLLVTAAILALNSFQPSTIEPQLTSRPKRPSIPARKTAPTEMKETPPQVAADHSSNTASTEPNAPLATIPPRLGNPMIEPAQSEATLALTQERDRLNQARQEMMAKLKEASPDERRQIIDQWRETNATAIKSLSELTRKLSNQRPSPEQLAPVTAPIPANATPEMRDFIIARQSVMKDQAEMMNQLRDASPQERQQAITKWREQNASRLEAIKTSAAGLSRSPSTPPPADQ